MGKKRIEEIIASGRGDELRDDITMHSVEYVLSKYGITKKERGFAQSLFGVKTPNVCKHWYTNGESDLSLPEDCVVPKGYHLGRTNCGKGTAGYFWINNGEKKKLVKKDTVVEDGYSIGMGVSTTKGKVLCNDGERNLYFDADAIPEGYVRGNVDTMNYKIATLKRRVFWYTNGVDDIKLKIEDKVPDGFVPGKAKKLSLAEQVKRRDDYYDSLGYIAIKNLTRKQLTAYCKYRDEGKIEPSDVIVKKDVYTYINKKYIPLFDEYSKTNHSKGTSFLEQDVISYVRSIYDGEIVTNCKKILRDDDNNYYEMDAYLPEKKIGIEVNGTYWHSTACIDDREYHLNKAKMAEKKGIRLIQIYQHEWEDDSKRDILKSMLSIALGKCATRIFARQCEVRKITNSEAKPFNDRNHLQGHRNAQVTYGLFHDGSLVQLMSFSKTKYNRNLKSDSSWEIIRGCPGSNNVVVGGVSKLLKHFIDENSPSEVFSYCDFNKFDGKGYEAIGMRFVGYTGPNKWWVLKDRSVVNRQPGKYRELKENSIACIYGAGSKKYILSIR